MEIHKKKILVVEAEKEMRELIAEKLKKSGYEVFQTGDGAEALQMAQKIIPDLILADIIIPVMDGLELLEKLNESYFGRDIPFVVITAKGYLKDYFERIGVDNFITKPCLPEDFLNKIEEVFASQQKAAQRAALIKKVLMVDAHPDKFESIMKILDTKGSRVDDTMNADQVVSEAIKFGPDIVLIESRDFISVTVEKCIRSLRQMPQHKKTPILIYNFNDQAGSQTLEINQEETKRSEILRHYLDAGATEYIGSFDETTFRARIDSHLRKTEIVVIDDDQGLTQLLKVELGKDGYKVETAPDGEKGLELVKKDHPRLVLLDLAMPGINGFEVLGAIRAEPSLRETPVVILTVRGEENAIQKALDLGANDYIIKPVYTGLLKKKIRVWVNGAKPIT